MPADETGARSASRQKHAGLLSHGLARMAWDFRHQIVAIGPRAVYADGTHPTERNHMTELSEAKGLLRESVNDGDNAYADYILTVLDALEELENSYVPHLPADTDTWLRDSQVIGLDHPLPLASQIKFEYGPDPKQFLTARISDAGLEVWAEHGRVAITPVATNVVTITGSIK